MTDAVEGLFISTGSEDNTTCTVQDLRTGTDLMRYKGGGIAQHHGLEMIGLNFVFAANSTKPLIHVWPINKQEQMASLRFVVPGKVNALALTPDGCFLVAGIQENIYLWHMNTGRMLNTLSKHYQAITCLRFTDNGEHFISGGKDGAVLVWDLTFCAAPLDTGSGQDSTEPLYSFNDHGLAVTDLYSGIGGIRSHLFTVSLDRCCNVYDLLDGTQLLSVVFPVALHSVIVNWMETHVYVGSGDGKVFVFHMEKAPRMKEYHVEEDELQAFVGHTAGKAITCLALNLSSTSIISGGEDNQVCVWDVSSRQLIKSLPQTGPVTNLCVRMLTPAVFLPEHKHRQPFADTLMRMITPRTIDDHIELLVSEEEDDDGRNSPEIDLTQSYPGTDAEILRQVIASMYVSKSQGDKDEAEDESDAEEVEEVDSEAEEQMETEAADEELSTEGIEAHEEDEEEEVEEEEEADEEEGEAVEEEQDAVEEEEDEDEAAEEEAGATANGVDVQKLLEENARLKKESKLMFETMMQYISSNAFTASSNAADSATKTKRKKPQKD